VTRVLIADDQAAVRAGFAALIDAEDEMEVAGEAGNGREAVDISRRVFPHVVLMDIRMPTLDGLEATKLICADPTLANTRVLVLTTFDLDEHVYAALRAGASGFCSRTPAPVSCCTRSGSLPPAKPCSPPRSRDGWSPSSRRAPTRKRRPRSWPSSPSGNARSSSSLPPASATRTSRAGW
jgi:CheY-like chemotaxis protein